MSTGSNIEWTEATWTPVKGCTRVSEGCDHCYAVGMTHRLEAMGQQKYAGLTVLNGRGERHFNGKVVPDADALTVPLHWKKPRTIFVSSMSDIFHKDVPFEFLDRIMATIMVAKRHTFQVLTKRPERAADYFAARPMGSWIFDFPKGHPQEGLAFKPPEWPPKNMWLGTSVENQRWGDERIPHLLKCPAAVRFLSMEPLLGPVDLLLDGECSSWRCPECGSRNVDPDGGHGGDDELTSWACSDCNDVGTPGSDADWKSEIDWVIVGGESGPKARPCDVAWIRSIVQQCKVEGVPCFVKQLGSRPAVDYYVDDDNEREWALSNERCVWNTDGFGRIGIEDVSKWHPSDGQPRNGAWIELALRDRKGGDMAEWPEDLRVRQMPEVRP